MIPLEMNVKICVLIGLFTISEDVKSKIYSCLSNGLITSTISYLVIISGAYCINNISDVEKVTYAFYVIAAGLLGLAWNGVLLMKRNSFKHLLLELQRIITERIEKRTSFDYRKIETNVRIFTKNYIIVFVVADLASMVIMPALVAGFFYIKGTFNLNSWYLPLVTITPYNQNSIVGHIISHLTQTAGITAIVAFLCPITTTYFAVCCYIEALFIDLANEQNQIDGSFEETPRRICVSNMKRRLVDLILSHNEIIRFMNDFREMVNGIVFSLFLIGISWLCSGLFQLKFSLDIMFLQNLSNLGLIISCMYTYCSNGTVVTYSNSGLAVALYNSLWYKYPLKLQPYLILMMSNAQKPFYFSGYEFGKCSMETFTSIMRTAFSILMVLRAVDRH